MIVRVFNIEGYLCSITVEEPLHSFRFALLSLEGTLSWTGQVGPELYQDPNFRKIITKNEDASDMALALAIDEGFSRQIFLFTLNTEHKSLVWKKKFAGGKLKKRIAVIQLEKKEYEEVLKSFFKVPFCSPEDMTNLRDIEMQE